MNGECQNLPDLGLSSQVPLLRGMLPRLPEGPTPLPALRTSTLKVHSPPSPHVPPKKKKEKQKPSTTLSAPLQNKTKPEKQLLNSPCVLLFIYYIRIIYIINNYTICIVLY